jgi:hypothetical protein
MQPLGAALINPTNGSILQSWDVQPAVITHAGEDRTGAIIGAEFTGGMMLVGRFLDQPPPRGNPPVTGQSEAYNGSVVVVTRQYGEVDLVPLKAAAKERISKDAEASRGKVLTLVGPGKGMSYMKVYQEALTFQAVGANASTYPLLQARVNSGRYATLAEAADGIVQIEGPTTAAAALIDEIEDRAKLAIDAATTLQQIDTAESVSFP